MPEIPKTYEPAAIEAKWYAFWEQNGCFTADPKSAKPAYSIVIPPPNITGVLHIGHVLNNTIQDILARRARMLGKEVLWLPGTDHAGISAQNVVEKTLRKEGVMKHRDDLGREALVAKIREWREKYGGIILKQLRALGCSLDWTRTRFTMDEAYSRCVSRVFVDLYRDGKIYRGKRMVNWCPASLTALSDEEVVMKEQKGLLYYFKVEVVEEPGRWLSIATTRPETIPGDTAVAVNPKDLRYAGLIGKHIRRPLPLENQAELPIIGDDTVAFDFGTGVLKVTPAHDKADFLIWQRIWTFGVRNRNQELSGMQPIEIMFPNGVLNELAGRDLAGLDRFEGRKRAAELLREIGVMEKEELYTNNVGFSERADVPIEPRLSEQWFLKYPSVEGSRTCVAAGAMRFFPDRWAKVYDHWLNGIQDWCIGRQLWWGHQIPVWKQSKDSTLPLDWAESLLKLQPSSGMFQTGFFEKSLSGQPGHTTIFRTFMLLDRESELFAATLSQIEGEELQKRGWVRDPDVLDTWFSSWLWPFATMGWPEKTDTLAKFYPTTDLVTGPDIIFFWVARMIMAGFEWMGEMPFRNVYFTSIIRDKQGRKLSKSLGNSPDPLDLMAKYGADGLRFGTMRSAPLGSDVCYDEKNIELGRNFCTKLWNAARFRQMQGGETEAEIDPALLTSDDKWILARLDDAIREVSLALDEYRFSDATAVLHRFFWSEFCDWYLEAAKPQLFRSRVEKSAAGTEPKVVATDPAGNTNTLAVFDFVFAHMLRILHPFLPFITEELWQGMGFAKDMPAKQGGETIMFAPWPKPMTQEEREYFDLNESVEKLWNAKYETVNAGRALRRDFNVANKGVSYFLRRVEPLTQHDNAVLQWLLNADEINVVEPSWTPQRGTPVALTPLGELFLPLDGLIDVAAERERIGKEIAKVEDELAKVRAKLADPNFAGKVPAKVLDEHQQRECDWAEKHAHLAKMRDALGES